MSYRSSYIFCGGDLAALRTFHCIIIISMYVNKYLFEMVENHAKMCGIFIYYIFEDF